MKVVSDVECHMGASRWGFWYHWWAFCITQAPTVSVSGVFQSESLQMSTQTPFWYISNEHSRQIKDVHLSIFRLLVDAWGVLCLRQATNTIEMTANIDFDLCAIVLQLAQVTRSDPVSRPSFQIRRL